MTLSNVDDVYPLSPLQMGILFECLYGSDRGLYTEQFTYQFDGALDVAAFRRAWERLVARHATLRTAFLWDGLEKPLQVVRKTAALDWTECDWRDRAPERQERDLADHRRSDRARGFALEEAPLMRLTLIRRSAQSWYFIWSHHHLLLDGWSVPVLLGDLIELYNRLLREDDTPLPPPRRYRDYIQWLQKKDQDKAREYWRSLLGDVGAPTPLRANLPASRAQAGYGHREFVLPAGLSAALEDLARRARVTLNTVFQGAWALLLARYCDADDVVFGATVSGRPPELPGVETMVGLFINTLPVRIDFRDGETILPWLARIMREQKEQDAYSYSALAEVQRASAIPPDTALFETLLVFENFPVGDAFRDGGDLSVRTVAIVEQTNYPLTLAVLPRREILLRFYHDDAIIDAATVGRLAHHLTRLLEGMAQFPTREPLRVPLLNAEERARVAAEQAADEPPPPCIWVHRAFERQAALRPDATALTLVDATGLPAPGENALSYGQLNMRANRLAHALIAEGIGPDRPVGLCFEPSFDLIVAILAVLKAGGCYVPIEPQWPKDRMAVVIDDAGIPLLLTAEHLSDALPETQAKTLICDGEPRHPAAAVQPNPAVDVGPDNLAYIIYTSGSTGRPKGVAVTHRNVARLFGATAPWFGFGPDDVWTLFHSAAFDFSVWEIWGALAHGGRLVIVPYLLARAPLDFHRLLCREQVTILNQTPSAFRQLIQADAERAGESCALRTVIFGGEALDYPMLASWFARHAEDAPRLVNMYGITETTVHVTYRPVRAADAAQSRSLIGRPIPDLRLYVLDRFGELQAPGLPGELYVGGPGVARGYLNRPELTAERFVRSDFASGGSVLYRTGDIVRAILDDGGATVELEYLGRVDDQVKIRGFRIETGDISAVLLRHPLVAECVVLAEKEASTGANRLVAYVVPDAEHAAPIRRRLRIERQLDGALSELPNGLAVAHLNHNETRFLYREIFEENGYLRHGIALAPGDVVFDVGANIGLFSLFAAETCGYDVTLHAFEPVGPVFERLRQNFELHGISGSAEPFGIADRAMEATIGYYPRLSILSGLHADRDEERETVASYEMAQSNDGVSMEIVDYRLEAVELPCRFITLSEAMRRQGVDRIDLLKIDVEKSELEVLEGIEEADWPRIRQIVIEVHDKDARGLFVERLLRRHGFDVVADRGKASQLVNLYARRRDAVPRAASQRPPPRPRNPEQLVGELRQALHDQVPGYMVPSDFVLTDAIPLTRNGKVDRVALQNLAQGKHADRTRHAAPEGEDEQLLAEIWREGLGVERVPGRDEDFFALGGHSLVATRVMSRIRETFALDLPMRELFEQPTIARLAARLGAFRRDRSAKGAVVLPQVAPEPAHRYDPFPLTEIQQAYWLGRNAAFELGNVATHGYMEVDCPDLDLPRFEAAWRRVVARHDMLRMIVLPSGEQQVREHVPPYVVAVRDLRDASPETRERDIRALRESMSHQILSAEEGRLYDIRARLLDDRTTRLFMSIDALWGDAFSMRLLVSELFAFYRNPDLAPPPLSLTFRDYVMAELAWQQSDWYGDSLRYWRDRLPDFPSGPDLPLKTNPAALDNPRFRKRASRLSPEDWSALKARAGNAGLTPSAVLLSAFADVLAFWSKSARFAINLTLFNRHPVHPEINRVIGDFTSLILLAVDNRVPDAFEARARRLQRQLWQDLDHRYVNGVTVLRELSRLRGARAAMPVVFTSTLGLAAGEGQQGQKPLGEVAYAITQTPQVWLDHKVSESDSGLSLEWDALEDLFPEGMLDDMFEFYCAQVRRLACSDAAWNESNADLAPPAAQLALRRAVNDTAVPVPDTLLHSFALACGDGARPAVIAPDRTLSYAELAALAERTARRLHAAGAEPGRPVAIVMEKGWAQIVAALGALRAGACYVPIDADLPPERLRVLLRESEARHVLIQARFRDAIAWPGGLALVCVDDDADFAEDAASPAAQSPADIAYVIFTSGSTGTPKGVMIDHRGALNTVVDINRRFGVGKDDRVLAVSALNFDLSVYDIFGVLGAGGAIVIPEPARRHDPAHWAELMARHRVTVWNTVPALMQMLVDHLEGAEPPPDLRLVMMSGDWIALNLPERIRALWPRARRISLGGATEASIWSIAFPIEEVDPAWKSIPYGKPLDNQTFHVLNEHLAPCPVWVPGELYIGGIGLALGYWRDAEKTAKSFITRNGERLYRTGDLGRYLPDGNIEFLGRADHQIKLRGHRIELGEIEAALLQHPHVREAVVGLYGERNETQRLVAHVVLEGRSDDAEAGRENGALLDKAERLQFRLSRPGLRPDAHALDGTALRRRENDQAQTSLYRARASVRRFANEPVPFDAFSDFLGCLTAIDLGGPFAKYRYPSAGNLYPVQAYVAVKAGRVEGLEGGLYYHHPFAHRLMRLGDAVDGAAFGPPGAFNRRIHDESGFALFLVARTGAMRPLYGDLTREFALLEAGYMSQLLMENATPHGIGLCPIGTIDFESVRAAFALEDDQILLHTHLGGAPAPEQPAQGPVAGAEDNLREFLAQKLPAYMVPGAIVSVQALPLTPNGKVDRAALTPPESARADASLFVAPRDWLEHDLMGVWQRLLDRAAPIGVHENFFDLGGNSLLAARLAAELYRHYARQLMLTDIFRNPTLSEMAAALRGGEGLAPPLSLVPMRTQGEATPFFCFPGSGGHALYLYHLARHMDSGRPFYALQPQAVDGESIPLTRVEAMAAHYLALMRSVQPHGPYLLGGHSLGAKVALEIAQQLMQAGESVALLAVFDSVPFYRGDNEDEDWNDVKWLAALARAAGEFGGVTQGDVEADLAPLSDDERLAYLKDTLARGNFLPADSSLKQVRAMVDVFRANTQANGAYREKETRPLPIVVFSPEAQSPGAREAMREAWSQIGPVDLYVTPGTHLTMLSDPHVRVLAESLERILRARA